MGHRQELIEQVKSHYARLADIEGKETYSTAQFDNMTVEAYYERLLSQVIEAIESGAYDDFTNGQEIIESIANRK